MKKILLILSLLLTLTGCKSNTPISDKQFCLDTIVQITIYDNSTNDILNHCFDICNEYELIFSPTNKNSELYKLNHSDNKLEYQSVNKELYKVIEKALYYSSKTQGQFDITVGGITNLWDFKAENPTLPDKQVLDEKLKAVGYQNIELKDGKIRYLNKDTMIDLGAIAKGYIADRIKEYLEDKGVKHALINLGGNVLCINDKNGEDFNIGLTNPKDTQNMILNLKGNGMSIVTSGTYQRCFTIDDKLYHHILDPKTGYSIDNGLASVTIISKSSLEGDALSTICFSLGKDQGIAFIEELEDVEGCFIDNDNNIYYTSNFKSYIK